MILTEILGRTVLDRAGRKARLVDLVVDLFGGDYPPVTHLLVKSLSQARPRRLVSWDAVLDVDDPIRVTDLAETGPCAAERLASRDLLQRDVLDALVVDLDRQRTVRVNDLWLRLAGAQPGGYDGGRLVVAGVDASARAVFRRIGGRLLRGLFGTGDPEGLIDWRDVELLHGDPRRTFPKPDLQPRVARLQPARIADLAEALPYLHAAELLNLLRVEQAADVFELLQPERQVQVIGELHEDRVVAILAETAPERAADVLGRLPLATARQLLERLPPRRAALIADLLRYPADTAGGIMTNEIVTVPVDLTVGEAIEYVRPSLARPDLVYYVYVVAGPGTSRLEGIVTLRDLLLARAEQPIAEVMNRDLVAATPLEPARQVAYRLADYQLNALPVVDANGGLLGAVTIDSAVAQIAPETLHQTLPRVFA